MRKLMLSPDSEPEHSTPYACFFSAVLNAELWTLNLGIKPLV